MINPRQDLNGAVEEIQHAVLAMASSLQAAFPGVSISVSEIAKRQDVDESTGVSCARLGRRFIGVELTEHYFDIACRRIADAYKQPRLFDEPRPVATQGSLL